MTSPSRTPSARRAERERNAGTYEKRYISQKDSPLYAQRILAREMGVSVAEVPAELAEARFAKIRAERAIREAQEAQIYPMMVEQYSNGATVRKLCAIYNFDHARVSSVLVAAGITLKRRPYCKRGHAMTPDNSAYTPEGWRKCRACACIRTKECVERKKARMTLDAAATPCYAPIRS